LSSPPASSVGCIEKTTISSASSSSSSLPNSHTTNYSLLKNLNNKSANDSLAAAASASKHDIDTDDINNGIK
jgi:hypothetical protein